MHPQTSIAYFCEVKKKFIVRSCYEQQAKSVGFEF